jgi:hypothetical protein
MMTRRFWKPVIISLVVTPIALFLGVLSAGAGHGHYGMAKLLFPYTMLPAMVSGQISSFFILLAVAQFPAYGIVLGLANEKGRARLGAVVLSIAHTTAVVAVLLSVSENFS